jgi:hypothetical protein
MDRSLVKSILQRIVTDGSIKETSKGLNFRCCKCGDSEKSKRLRRGWILFKNDMITYFCHNCGFSQSFKNFVREYSPELYKEYFKNKDIKNIFKKNYDVGAVLVSDRKKIDNIDDLSKEILPYSFPLLERSISGIYKKELQKKAVQFVRDRKIPKKFYKDFLVCYGYDDPEMIHFKDRLIIPYYDENRKMYCFSARALYGETPKYLTWNRDNIKIFNFYNVDKSQPTFIFEGAIDSMFVPNSTALTGVTNPDSDQFKMIKKRFPLRIWVTDNQWCDETGMKVAKQMAGVGENIFVYPKIWRQWKDLNEIILSANLTSEAAYSIILDNVYKGKTALLKLKLLKS